MRHRVEDLMTEEVVTVRADCELHELEKLLQEHRVHGVPVVNEAGRIVGVVSQTDLLAWHFEAGVDGAALADAELDRSVMREYGGRLAVSDIRSAQVAEVMSPPTHTVRPDTPIGEAAERMVRQRIHRLIVVDGRSRVVGILSALDLLRAVGPRA